MSYRRTKRQLRHLIQITAPGILALFSYRASWLPKDLAAGLSVATIALPVGIAYASLAGVSPVIGMYSAIFPLFAYALFGSSRQLIVGPDAVTCILVAATLGPLAGGDPERYTTLLLWLTVMTGLLYLFAGVIKLGFVANFLSQPILTGYLNGIALLIVVGQVPKLLGYTSTEEQFTRKILEFFERVDQSHWPTAALGTGMLVMLVLIIRFMPRLPGAFVVVGLSIILVAGLGLDQQGVAILGEVPSGLPSIVLPSFDAGVFNDIFGAAAGLVLVSFTSGVLTAKSFAHRNGYEVNANQELIGFGVSNLASGLAQGFPVTGADSRTAVNDAAGGKTQMVGVVAGVAMLLVLFFLTSPLAYVPITALAAVILVFAIGLFDLSGLRLLYRMSYREFLMSASTTLGVLVLGVLPGILLAVGLSLIWLLSVESRPNDAVLGRVKGRKGFLSVADYPNAKTIPGLLLYRFESNLVFYNADYMKTRVRAAVAAQKTPVEWVVLDVSSINIVDATGLRKFDELCEELAAVGVSVYIARVNRQLGRFFNKRYAKQRRKAAKKHRFQTLKPAINAYLKYQKAKIQKAKGLEAKGLEAKGLELADREAIDPGLDLGSDPSLDPGSDEREWREQIEPLPRMKQGRVKQGTVPVPPEDAGPPPSDRPDA